MKKLIAGAMTTVAVGALVPLLAAAPANADAQAKVCKPGSVKLAWSGVSKKPTLTHAEAFQNGIKSTVTVKAKLRQSTSVRAAVSGKAKPATVLAGLQKRTMLKLASVGAKTPAIVAITAKAKPGKSVPYAGTTKAAGAYTARTCNKTGSGYGTALKGKAVSFTAMSKGAIGCKVKVVNNPLAEAAQKKYCRHCRDCCEERR